MGAKRGGITRAWYFVRGGLLAGAALLLAAPLAAIDDSDNPIAPQGGGGPSGVVNATPFGTEEVPANSQEVAAAEAPMGSLRALPRHRVAARRSARGLAAVVNRVENAPAKLAREPSDRRERTIPLVASAASSSWANLAERYPGAAGGW